MARHVRVQCALIRPQGTKDSSTRDPDVNHSTFNTHTYWQRVMSESDDPSLMIADRLVDAPWNTS